MHATTHYSSKRFYKLIGPSSPSKTKYKKIDLEIILIVWVNPSALLNNLDSDLQRLPPLIYIRAQLQTDVYV